MAASSKSESVKAPSTSRRPEQAPALAHAAVEVIALTARDDFLLELGQCLDGTASIAPVETIALALAAAARSKRMQVIAIDSRDLADLRVEVDLLQGRAPALTPLVFAEQDAEVKVAAALKGSSVFAVLPLPVDPRKTFAVFEGAVADARSRRSAARPSGSEAGVAGVAAPNADATREGEAAAAAPAADQDDESPRHAAAGGRKIGGVALAAVACVVIAAAAAAWFLMRGQAPAPDRPPPVSAGAVPAVTADALPAEALPSIAGNVDELLEKGRVAMRERRYTEPANDSALLYYRSAVQADPGNAEAIDGLNRLRTVIVARFDELTKAGRHDEAAAALAQLASALPADPSLAELRLRLASARIAKAIEEGEVDRVTALVRSAQATHAVPAPQVAKWRAEISGLNEKARQEQQAERQARDAATAQQKARESRAAEAAREAQLARERESAQKLEAERTQAVLASAETAEADGAAAKGSGLRVEPKLKRSYRPEFPAEALDKGISGVVTVRYTVDAEGKTQNVRVESSEPPGIFDKAAMSAVRRWRYEPATLDGVPTEVELRIAIRFKLPE